MRLIEHHIHKDVQVAAGGEVLIGPEGTRLVNISDREDEVDHYVDRRSRWGNPYRMKEDGGSYTREGCVAAYKRDFEAKVRVEENAEEIEAMRGDTLGCWCLPKLCHGVIILNHLAETA